eukprot:TRINITY_DN972_c0_g1_i2.p1 TRINITY_DN972_c0_g1~~TRINITY_DN972_c0_g1_i2.p1  ORF type:complete len:573 (-),score=114.27 TRINITY_DN972_c0_g1_i2:1005-2723(-)
MQKPKGPPPARPSGPPPSAPTNAPQTAPQATPQATAHHTLTRVASERTVNPSGDVPTHDSLSTSVPSHLHSSSDALLNAIHADATNSLSFSASLSTSLSSPSIVADASHETNVDLTEGQSSHAEERVPQIPIPTLAGLSAPMRDGIVRVYRYDASYRAFRIDDSTSATELILMASEKFGVSAQDSKLCLLPRSRIGPYAMKAHQRKSVSSFDFSPVGPEEKVLSLYESLNPRPTSPITNNPSNSIRASKRTTFPSNDAHANDGLESAFSKLGTFIMGKPKSTVKPETKAAAPPVAESTTLLTEDDPNKRVFVLIIQGEELQKPKESPTSSAGRRFDPLIRLSGQLSALVLPKSDNQPQSPPQESQQINPDETKPTSPAIKTIAVPKPVSAGVGVDRLAINGSKDSDPTSMVDGLARSEAADMKNPARKPIRVFFKGGQHRPAVADALSTAALLVAKAAERLGAATDAELKDFAVVEIMGRNIAEFHAMEKKVAKIEVDIQETENLLFQVKNDPKLRQDAERQLAAATERVCVSFEYIRKQAKLHRLWLLSFSSWGSIALCLRRCPGELHHHR